MSHNFFMYLEQMEEIALIEEPDSTIKYANQTFLTSFGFADPSEPIGLKLLDFILPEDRDKCNMEMIVTPENPSYKVHGRCRNADGKIIWIQFIGRGIFNERRELIEFQEVGIDITEFKESINEKVKILEKANQRINDLTAPKRKDKDIAKKQTQNRGPIYNFSDIIRKSESMEEVIYQAKAAAERNTPVLIEGESGTGKELFAQSIHNYSKRANGPFIAVNCGAIPAELIESELFGYVEGAFTGAVQKGKVGKFEQASWGTLFLDEIGEMPLAQQAALLRVLETNSITRIGGDEEISIDVRIICATNKNLKEESLAGRFREDLYYRLNVMALRIPPLRERREDILELVDVFVKQLGNRSFDRSRFYDTQIVKIFEYDWPGNVRELKNVIERIIFLPGYDLDELTINKSTHISNGKNREYNIKPDTERQNIIDRLKEHNGNVSQVARSMGISRKTLYKKFKKYDIKPKQ